MYGQVVRPDRELSTILDRFVCVRITRISDLDHGLFRFDMNLSFAVLFMNGDLDLYGRYGTRAGGGFSAAFKPLPGAADLASRDISRESFRKAAERALALHRAQDKTAPARETQRRLKLYRNGQPYREADDGSS